MNVFLDVVLIQILMCFIIDLSGFIQEMESLLSKKLHFKCVIPKPFSCSLCMGWWTNIIFLICTGQFSLFLLVYVAMISFFSKNISGFLRWISELLVKIECLLYKIIR